MINSFYRTLIRLFNGKCLLLKGLLFPVFFFFQCQGTLCESGGQNFTDSCERSAKCMHHVINKNIKSDEPNRTYLFFTGLVSGEERISITGISFSFFTRITVLLNLQCEHFCQQVLLNQSGKKKSASILIL